MRDDVPAGDVEHAARDAAGDLAEEVALFDRFVGGNVPAGHASLALHVVYRAPDRTLTDADVDARHAQVVAALEKRFGASLRGASVTPANAARATIEGSWPPCSPVRPVRSRAPFSRAGGG